MFALALAVVAAAGKAVSAQTAPTIVVGNTQITGLPDDWSHHYLVFSNPGTEEDAIKSGHYQAWLNVVNQPRYVLQQLKRNSGVQGPAAGDVAFRESWMAGTPRNGGWWNAPGPIFGGGKRGSSPVNIKKDWSESLGTADEGGLAAGQFPAKYSFSDTVANCSDYIVFPTGHPGSSSQATIVAYYNIYVGATGGCGGNTTSPSVYWAFNTPPGGTAADSATADLSPVLSLEGDQVAFMETYDSDAYLVILRMPGEGASAGTVSAPVTPTYKAPASYLGCTAPCYTTIALTSTGTSAGTAEGDSNSAPYYVYFSDILYVGDNGGYLHKFTGIFGGTPAETTTNWPVTVYDNGTTTETTTNATNPSWLTSPVWDSGASQLIFVNDGAGYLHSVTVSGTLALTSSDRMECGNPGFSSAPVVDSSTEEVYDFIGSGCDESTAVGNSYINRFAAGTSINASYGTYESFGNHTTNTTATIGYAGTFDDEYFMGTGTTGNVYSCVNGRIYQIPLTTINGGDDGTVNIFNTAVSDVESASICSPMTEFAGAKANTTLSAAITSTTSTSVSVASTTGMATGDYIQIGSEIMHITTLANPLTVTRGQLGTTAATHSNGAAVQDVQDWLFVSVEANGSATGCTGACLYNYSVLGAGATGTATAGIAATGGTSGIIVDNESTTQTGAEQIYYSTLGNATTPSTAVQTSQSAP